MEAASPMQTVETSHGTYCMNRRFAEMETWQDEDNETREMDAEEKVDMWRNSGVQEEPESGGSSTTKRRSALPMEFRSNMVSALRVRTVCNIC